MSLSDFVITYFLLALVLSCCPSLSLALYCYLGARKSKCRSPSHSCSIPPYVHAILLHPFSGSLTAVQCRWFVPRAADDHIKSRSQERNNTDGKEKGHSQKEEEPAAKAALKPHEIKAIVASGGTTDRSRHWVMSSQRFVRSSRTFRIGIRSLRRCSQMRLVR